MDTDSPGESGVVARNAIVRTAGEIVAKVASLAFFVALARELGEAEFGDFMFALSFTTVVLIASGFGTEELLARDVARDRSRVHDYLSNVVTIKAATSVFLLGAALLVVTVGSHPRHVQTAVLIVGAGVAIENLGRTWQSVFQAFERMSFISISLIAQRVFTAGFALLTLYLGGGIIEVSLIFLAGALLGFCVAYLALRRYVVRPRMQIDATRWWGIVKAGVPIGAVTLLFTVLLKLDQTLIAFLGDGDNNAEVGFYAAAFRLVESTMFISWAFAAAMLPYIARRDEGHADVVRGYELAIKVMALVLMPLGLGFALFADDLIGLLYGPSYDAAVLPLRYLGLTSVFYGINTMAATVLIARDRPGEFTRLLVLVTVQNVITNILLIPPYGAAGAAAAAASSGVLLGILSVLRVSSLLGRVRVTHAFAGSLLGAGAMTAVAFALPDPWVVSALLGGLAYLGAVTLFERAAFPEDFAVTLDFIRQRGRDGGDEPAAGDEPAVDPATADVGLDGYGAPYERPRLTRRPPLALAYHGVADVSREHDPHNLMLPPPVLRDHLRRLRSRGYRFVPLSEMGRLLHAGESLDGLCALTFDDGTVDNIEVLPGILEELDACATVLVCPGLFGEESPWLDPESGLRLMTADEVRTLSSHPRFEIGSHTVCHTELWTASYDEALHEMRACKEQLESLLDTEVATFAYPRCGYSPACLDAARDAGYVIAVTCGPRGGLRPYDFRRESPDPLDGPLTFGLKARGLYFPLRNTVLARLVRRLTRPWRHRRSRQAA